MGARTLEQDRAKKERKRRLAGVAPRRTGDEKLTSKQRKLKHKLAHDISPGALPAGDILAVPAAQITDLHNATFANFESFLNSAQRPLVVAKLDPGVAASLKLTSEVPLCRLLPSLLRFWYIDNRKTWELCEHLCVQATPNWLELERVLRSCKAGQRGPTEHRRYNIPSMIGFDVADHASVVLRSWRLSDIDLSSAQVKSLLQQQDDLETLLRRLSRLKGIGPWMGASVTKTLVCAKIISPIRPCVIGRGSMASLLWLKTGERRSATECAGLWPWQKDASNLRGILYALCRRLNKKPLDLQHALCNFQRQ